MIKKVTFKSGNLELEGLCHYPSAAIKVPGVVLCHPHPLYGGDMNNNIVTALCQALEKNSIVALRFNFRGVGKSQGSFDNGIGEGEDLKAALSYLSSLTGVDVSRIGLAGYSFGAGVTLNLSPEFQGIKALSLISPPLSFMPGFTSFKKCLKPKFIVSGGQDSYVAAEDVRSLAEGLLEPKKVEIISEADHFWWGWEDVVAKKVADFFVENL